MMFPIGTGRRKADLLPHRSQAVALIWKMISVLLEPINIILVSPVNDTFLPSIVHVTEEEMSVTGSEERRTRKRKGGGILLSLVRATGESFTPQTVRRHPRLLSPSISSSCARRRRHTQLINHAGS